MSTPYDSAIEALKMEIAEKEAQLHAELLPLKTMVNGLCKRAGLEETYVLGETPSSGKKQVKIEEGQFFNKPLASCVSTFMELRDALSLPRPTNIDEIYDALVQGNYKFEGGGLPENSKRALKISLTKNTAQFCKVGEKFALRKWYGIRSPRKTKSGEPESATDVDASSSDTSGDNNPDAVKIFSDATEPKKS